MAEAMMAANPVTPQVEHRWYARPVFFVDNLHRALLFYVDLLGFQKVWHEGNGSGTVCQVDRAGCEIILCEDGARRDRGRLFVSLTEAGIAQLRREIIARSVPYRETWWGYDAIQIEDPDGNELLLPHSLEATGEGRHTAHG